MNPQYLPPQQQQQYFANLPPQNFPNSETANSQQGFQNVPLVGGPPKPVQLNSATHLINQSGDTPPHSKVPTPQPGLIGLPPAKISPPPNTSSINNAMLPPPPQNRALAPDNYHSNSASPGPNNTEQNQTHNSFRPPSSGGVQNGVSFGPPQVSKSAFLPVSSQQQSIPASMLPPQSQTSMQKQNQTFPMTSSSSGPPATNQHNFTTQAETPSFSSTQPPVSGTLPVLTQHLPNTGIQPSIPRNQAPLPGPDRPSSGNQTPVSGPQPPLPGQQSQFTGQSVPVMQARPFLSGQPPVTGQQERFPGQQPPLTAHQQPGQQPAMPGQQILLEQQNSSGPNPSTHQNSLPGQRPPWLGPQNTLPVQQPTLPGQEPTLPGQHSALPGQQPTLVGQQLPLMPGQQQSLTGRHPLMPGQQQSLPGQQPPMHGQQHLLHGQQPPIPGQQHSSHGQHPPLSAQQTLFADNQHSFPGQPPLLSGPQAGYPTGSMGGQQQMPPRQNLAPGQLGAGSPQMPLQTSHVGIGGRPPLPGQQQRPPMPGQQFQQPSTQFTPPVAGQYNQLSNQMQGMNLGPPGPRQYAGMPAMAKSPMDNSLPHMPPPLNQQNYVNGPLQQQQQPGGPPPRGGPYPPMPGQTPAGPYPQQPYQQTQQAQQKRLDPDQMPSPVQVTQDDQVNRSGVFVTNQKGLVPPLVTTNFIVQDQGNCSPRFIRSTMYNVPISQDIMKHTAVPFSLLISPMARVQDQEFPPPIVNFGDLGPVRCIRCKAYMCPFMQFIDSGRRFQCLFCKATTDVPTEYFQHLDHTGQRIDKYERPELVLGTYEFVATADYCRNNVLPKPPAMIFVIDVSYNNIKSGLVHLLCANMKEIIKHLPVDQGKEESNMRVGFITYNSSVHFYNIKGTLAAPQMLVVGDTQEMFMPLLDGFLCTPEESEQVIDALMEEIPMMFGETKETETVLLPAILAGLEALKASESSGKLLVFHSSLPTAEAPGKLKNRDDRKLLGTDKERTVLTPQTQAYNQLGQDCVGMGCSVDLFLFNNSFIDIATIGQVSRMTGGEVFKYTYFQADIDGDRVINDVIMDISRPIAFDGIMRVRTSTGIRPTEFYGHFFMSNTTDMELAAIDCDKAVAVEIKHDDKLSEEEGVYIQSALLYTSCSGQRRLRIINLSLKCCSQMADLYRSCDLDTIINYISKQSVYKLLDNNPKAVKDAIVTRAAQILATYRKNCASPSSAGQLILPECMKLLPLYVNCLLKSDALSGGSDMTIDDRAFVMQTVMIMDVPTSVHHFYPRLIPIHDLDLSKQPVAIPSPVRCTIEKMSEQGAYILENGIHMFLWIGLGVNPDFCQNVFGAPSAIQIDIEKPAVPELDNPMSIAVRNIIEEIRIQRHRYMRLTVVRQREKLEPVFKHFLVEDRGTDGTPSYVDFLCHMHKEIRSLLS